MFQKPETAMKKITKLVLVGTATLTILNSAALTQQARTGPITKVDLVNGTVAVQQTHTGTTGANTGGAKESKTHQGLSLDPFHPAHKPPFPTTSPAATPP